LGVVSSALPSLSQTFDLSHSQQENVVGVLYLGSAAGSAFGGFLCDYLGRKSGILFTDVVFMVGALLLAFANSVPTLIIGKRLFLLLNVAYDDITVTRCSLISFRLSDSIFSVCS
jgi:MFS family permease